MPPLSNRIVVSIWLGTCICPATTPIIFGSAINEPTTAKIQDDDQRPITAGDRVIISVTDLVGPGVVTEKHSRIDTNGNVDLALIGKIKAAGLTLVELEGAIVKAYRDASLVQDAQVSVSFDPSSPTTQK